MPRVRIARCYAATVRFDAERLSHLETQLTEAFDQVIAYRTRQLAGERVLLTKLQTERRRLLDAHLAGAVPLDLFAEKQDELNAKLGSV